MRSLCTRAILVGAVVVLVHSIGSPGTAVANADIGGSWHFSFGAGRGAALLHFPSPEFGTFKVTGAGYTPLFPDAAFSVTNSPAQTLTFSSVGDIHGAIALDNVTHTSRIGTLTITRGVLNRTNDRAVLRGTLAIGDAAAKPVSLVGTRVAAPAVSPVGRAFDARLRGPGCISNKFDVEVATESGVVSQGFPFFLLDAGGPAHVDGVETTERIQGLLVSDVRGAVFGRVTSERFGACNLAGRFVTKTGATPEDVVPVLRATLTTTTVPARRVRLTAVLE